MSLLAVGLNHTTAPVDVRERLAVPREQIGESLAGLRQHASLSEVVLLSTCNRVEVYAVQPDAAAPDRIVDALAQLRGMSGELVRRHCFVREHDNAARHIFRVAASLESMVVGEPQILGQVKDAWQLARERQTVGPILDRCLTMAFRGAKRVRSETDVARGGASVASVAVELARSIFGQLRGSTVALIGAGEMGRQAALHLRADGAEQVLVVNRSRERGEELAGSIGGRYLGWDQLDEALVSADVVITSTGANSLIMPNQPMHIIEPRMMRRIMRRRRGAPIFIVDIAVPRDVDPKVGRLDSVYVYDVDDLQKILGQNLQARGHEAEAAGAVLEQEIAAFLHWQRARALNPVIRDLRAHARSIMQHELDKALVRLGQLGELDEAQREVVAALGHAITQKILHQPLKALRESAIHAEGDDLSGALRTLFALEQALDEQDVAIEVGEVDETDEPVDLS
uniref:Glutamyl-tRNA reductase n=1 Tax=uncultured bacterium pSY1435 TaxID=561717 RepID=C4N417_9BACT|nr:glutamyl tRNA reductase [uncultured bacterium pSY1435]